MNRPNGMRLLILFFVYLVIEFACLNSKCLAAADILKPIPDEMLFEATLSNNANLGYPLPFAAHWNRGDNKGGYNPDYQMEMINNGHYLLPWFTLPDPNSRNIYLKYYETAIRKAAKLHLPISFISTQWESMLSQPPYFNYPSDRNPNVIDTNGKIFKKVSPFGPVEAWREVGVKWTHSALLKKLQEWYPDPPLVIFVSNNEHSKLTWRDVEQSKRYLSKYGVNKDDDFKRKVVGDGWIERYRALQNGMKEGLESTQWKQRSVFIGYDAFGSRAFGRWDGWMDYSLSIPGRLEPWPLAWDGASVSYYLFNWDSTTDYTVWSPQIESMNWVPMLNEARRINPDFRFEMSTWDGYEPILANDKRKFFANSGQVYNPERYEGLVQYGMWLLRPCIVREFRNHLATLSDSGSYFLSVVRPVDLVHTNPVLRKFWRRGRLVANNEHQHPYQSQIPGAYKSLERWFLLDTNLDPKRPWSLSTEIPVYSLALTLGTKPKREWLVYAHSPLKDRKNVLITIPGYSHIKVDVPPVGTFYHVTESNNVVERLI